MSKTTQTKEKTIHAIMASNTKLIHEQGVTFCQAATKTEFLNGDALAQALNQPPR